MSRLKEVMRLIEGTPSKRIKQIRLVCITPRGHLVPQPWLLKTPHNLHRLRLLQFEQTQRDFTGKYRFEIEESADYA